MKQVFIIHGGDSFATYDEYLAQLSSREVVYESLKIQKRWKSWIAEQLLDSDVLLPNMPNSDNAAYDEWRICFEKLLPFFGDDVRLIGHSLGAMFLVKYLNDRPLKREVHQLILIAGGYDDDPDGGYGSFSITSVKHVPDSAQDVHLFHSKDDPVFPFNEMEKLAKEMPGAKVHTFSDRQHFNQATFPELLELLR